VEGVVRTAVGVGGDGVTWNPRTRWKAAETNGWSVPVTSGGGHGRLTVVAADGAARVSVRLPPGTWARFLRLRFRFPGFDRIFDPEPTWTYEPESPAGVERRQDLGDSPGRFGGDWVFTPPPYVFAIRTDGRWTALGLGADAGRLDFVRFSLRGDARAASLDIEIDFGRRRDLGRPLPDLWLHFDGRDRYAAIGRHLARYHRRSVAAPGPIWWRRPIFCGWGEQLVRARIHKAEGRQSDFCRQAVYEEFLRQIDNRKLRPGTLTIDDKWQATYGGLKPDPAKWPAMRKFIDRCHARDLRVLLWIPLWHPEGLPPGWCIHRDGKPYKADPRNPDYLHHLADHVRFLLHTEGLDADGLKVDWTNQGPWDLTDHADEVWGVELLRRYHAAVYEAAKATKPEALVITHAFHPAFLDHGDMLRLNDIMPWCKDVVGAMRHRARMARLLDPHVPIDCDNCSMPDRKQWLAYMKVQPELGVPSLYFLTHVDGSLEPIRDEDWEVVRSVWERYERRLAGARD